MVSRNIKRVKFTRGQLSCVFLGAVKKIVKTVCNECEAEVIEQKLEFPINSADEVIFLNFFSHSYHAQVINAYGLDYFICCEQFTERYKAGSF